MSRARARPGSASKPATELVTEGQRLIREVNATTADIAEACGVSKGLVSGWRTGKKIPGLDARDRVHAAYGIPPRAWEVAPGAKLEDPVTAADAVRVLKTVEGGELPGTMEMVEEQIAILRREQQFEDLNASERVRYADALGRLLSRRDEIEKSAADLVKVILAHPDWIRFWAVLEQKLADHPDVLKDLADEVSGWRMAR